MLPEGLTYVEELVTPDEERRLLDAVEGLDFRTLTMRGQAARRTVRHFGLDYAYESGELVPGDPLPEPLRFVRDRCAALIERDPEDLVQVLVSRYPMRFQRTLRGERETAAVELAPRSAYVLAGKARWSWQHSIPAAKALRCSITFRTLRRG